MGVSDTDDQRRALTDHRGRCHAQPATGKLTPKSPRKVATAGVPSELITISPDGKNAYVTSEGEGALSQFAISPLTGKITPLSPVTVTAPSHGSLGVAVTP